MVAMTLIDVWAATAATLAGACLAMRSNMLRPNLAHLVSAPSPVFFSLSLESMALLAAVVNIVRGGHASLREAIVYSVVAGAALVMLINLAAQRVAEEVPDIRS